MGYEILSAIDHYGNEMNMETKRKLQQKCIMAPRFLREMLEAFHDCLLYTSYETGSGEVDLQGVLKCLKEKQKEAERKVQYISKEEEQKKEKIRQECR